MRLFKFTVKKQQKKTGKTHFNFGQHHRRLKGKTWILQENEQPKAFVKKKHHL